MPLISVHTATGGLMTHETGLSFALRTTAPSTTHLFGVEPESGVVMVNDGLTLETLGITKKTLEHLPARPHAAALEWCWSKFHPAR
jgi:hypothetical protein